MSFEKFIKYSQKNKRKLVVILGSGFHANVLGKEHILSCWKKLLENCIPEFNHTGNYLHDFERSILTHENNEAAYMVENKFLKIINEKIKTIEKEVLTDETLSNKYPTFLFNPEIVSDIISLNFDTIALNLCKKTAGYSGKLLKTEVPQTSISYWDIPFPSGEKISFWYPHGKVGNYKSLILGLRRYSMQTEAIEKMRKRDKQSERNKSVSVSWYSKILNNPVLIIGAEISPAEWDLWSAIINRERNFAKSDNIKYRTPMFQLRVTNLDNPNNHLNSAWFEPCFDESLCYTEQWKKLNELFSSKSYA